MHGGTFAGDHLAVMERLFWLMAANNAYDNNKRVDFGKVREEAFWRGLNELATATAEATEEIKALAGDLYDEVRKGVAS